MIERFKNRKARRSFILKFHACIEELAKVPKDKIEDLVEYFRITTKFIDSLTPRECAQASKDSKGFISNVGRGAWNNTPSGKETKSEHVFVNPTGHFDEFYRCRPLLDLMANPGKKHDQFGFAKRDMDDKEFYFECFVKPFMVSNYNHARDCYKEMTGVKKTQEA